MTININSWQKQNLPGDVGSFVMARDALYILADCNGNIYLRTPTSGNNYEKILDAPAALEIPYATGLGISADGKYIVVGYSTYWTPYPSYGYKGIIYISSDYGKTFRLAGGTPENYAAWGIPIGISDNGKYMFASSGTDKVLISDDYGAHWRFSSSDVYYYYSDVYASESGQYVKVYAPSIFYSTDYGNSWQHGGYPEDDTFSFWGIAPTKDGMTTWAIGLAAQETGGDDWYWRSDIYKSTDSCATWTKLPFVFRESDGGDRISCNSDGSVLFITDSYEAWISEDGGGTYTAVQNLPEFTMIDCSFVATYESKTVFGFIDYVYGSSVMYLSIGKIKAVSTQDYPTKTKIVGTVLKKDIKSISSQED